jgi:hypothetical protein
MTLEFQEKRHTVMLLKQKFTILLKTLIIFI